MVHIRLDRKTKDEAAETLEYLGLSMSEAVRLFLHRVAADQAFPLELKLPNAETRAAMIEARKMAKAPVATHEEELIQTRARDLAHALAKQERRTFAQVVELALENYALRQSPDNESVTDFIKRLTAHDPDDTIDIDLDALIREGREPHKGIDLE
jgi:DNA-damage-inducible protein J